MFKYLYLQKGIVSPIEKKTKRKKKKKTLFKKKIGFLMKFRIAISIPVISIPTIDLLFY
jgi:hypothetical protein